ncbi:hypothetical protein AAC387_Pa03g0190 [Persea americana]
MVKRDCTRGTCLLIIFLIFFQCNRIDAIYRNRLNLATQFLAPHNEARAALGMRPLVWDWRVARYAAWYANQRRGDCALRHSNGPYGENIFWGSGGGWTPAQVVGAWVEERKWYQHRTNSCAGGQECGHYTQIIWGSTRRVGCAMVTCLGSRGEFITCKYDPPGNYIGERPY